jgi:hypothetical protein
MVLLEKAQSNQGKANKLEQSSAPLADAASKNLGAKDMAAAAKPVMAQAASVAKQVGEAAAADAAAANTRLNIKA